MNPKKKAPLFKDSETQLCWMHKLYDQKELDHVDEFLKKNLKELTQQMTPNLIDSFLLLCKTLGLHPHPALKEWPSYIKPILTLAQDTQQTQANQQLQVQPQPGTTIEDNKYLIIQNQRIDAISIKMLAFAWNFSPAFNVIKFSNNQFEDQEAQQLAAFLSNPQNRVFKLFFEWNPLQSSIATQFYQKIVQNEKLEMLILRCNKINDDILAALCDSMVSTHNLNLKYLELYGNEFTKAGIEKMAAMLEQYQKLEYLGLAQNKIKSFSQVESLFRNIGKRKLTPEEIIEHKQKSDEREQLIQKFTKQKKKYTEEQLPKVLPLVTLADGSPAFNLNSQLKMINLSINDFGETDISSFEKLATTLPDDIQIVLSHNNFDLKSKDKLRKKLQKKVYF